MKWLIWLLGLFSAAVIVAMTANNPGYVLVVYPPWRIELSLTLFMAALFVLLLAAYATLHLVLVILRLPEQVRRHREVKATLKSREAMTEALTAFFEGRYAAAERAAVRAMDSGDNSGINSIIAARAAHELREFDKRDQYLANASGKAVGESTMRLIARTEFMLDQKQPQLALDTLKELSVAGMHKHIGALQLELKAQQQAHNWDGVLSVIAQLEKRSAIAEVVATQLRLQAWMEKLRENQQDLPTLQALWKTIPGTFKLRPKLAALAAASFIRLRDCRNAQQLLTASLNKQWDSELVALYGDCQIENNIGQIEQAEAWLKEHPEDAGLLLALGKLCLHHGLWGKSQGYLQASVSLSPSAAAYHALARLSERLEKHEEATHYHQLAQEIT